MSNGDIIYFVMKEYRLFVSTLTCFFQRHLLNRNKNKIGNIQAADAIKKILLLRIINNPPNTNKRTHYIFSF